MSIATDAVVLNPKRAVRRGAVVFCLRTLRGIAHRLAPGFAAAALAEGSICAGARIKFDRGTWQSLLWRYTAQPDCGTWEI